jgi:hypothetical protein
MPDLTEFWRKAAELDERLDERDRRLGLAPELTLIQGAGVPTDTPEAETNEQRSERLGFTFTDKHRAIENAVGKLKTRQPARLTVIDGGDHAA